MSDNQDFSLSIKYSMPLIKNVSFKQSVYFLLSRIINRKSIRETHKVGNLYLDNFLTILKKPKFCRKDCENSTKDGKDYRLYNLTRNIQFPLQREFVSKNGVRRKYTYGIALWFNDKHTCKSFLKDLNARPQDVIFAAYIAEFKMYEVVLKFSNGITPKQERQMLANLNYICEYAAERYNSMQYSTKFYIPATIYDRWFDPFAQKVLWSASKIKESFNNIINFSDFMSNLFIIRRKLISKNCKNKAQLMHFISNINLVPNTYQRENLYIVNHYINDLNPYKRKNARKDWKFAAEQYLNEVLGKYKYRMNQLSKELAEAQELAISQNVDVNTYQRFVDESKAKVEKYESRLDSLNEDQLRDYKIQKDNIILYSDIRDKHIAQAKESAKQLFNKYIDDRKSLFFSKKEAEYFIKSLCLKTKISAVKLRKIVLDKIVELNMLDVKNEYRSKVSCRKYLISKSISNFYNFIKDKLSSFIFYINNYYMLQNSSSDKFSTDTEIDQFRLILDYYDGPPD